MAVNGAFCRLPDTHKAISLKLVLRPLKIMNVPATDGQESGSAGFHHKGNNCWQDG